MQGRGFMNQSQQQDEQHVVRQPPPHSSHGRFALGLTAAVAASSLIVAGLGYALLADPAEVHAEGMLIESMQEAIWLIAAGCGLLALPRQRSLRARAIVRLLGVLALVALAREFDLQEALNPEAMGSYGVHYRIDWWLSTESPVLPRILWAVVAVLLGWLVVTVLSLLRPDPVAALRTGDHSAWMLVAGFAFLFMGYFVDDQLRGVVSGVYGKAWEEVSELIGAALYLGAVIARLRPASFAVPAVRTKKGEPAPKSRPAP